MENLDTALSVNDGLPWIGITLDQTDRVCALVTPELAAWRPADPAGRFCFSLGEIVLHLADSRRMFLGQLDGADYSGGFWALGNGPDERGVWRFRFPGHWEEAQESLVWASGKLHDYLQLPAEALFSPTEGTRKFFEKYHADLLAAGREAQASQYARRGPASLARTMTALACHEAGHRGSLQTLLHQHGLALVG